MYLHNKIAISFTHNIQTLAVTDTPLRRDNRTDMCLHDKSQNQKPDIQISSRFSSFYASLPLLNTNFTSRERMRRTHRARGQIPRCARMVHPTDIRSKKTNKQVYRRANSPSMLQTTSLGARNTRVKDDRNRHGWRESFQSPKLTRGLTGFSSTTCNTSLHHFTSCFKPCVAVLAMKRKTNSRKKPSILGECKLLNGVGALFCLRES